MIGILCNPRRCRYITNNFNFRPSTVVSEHTERGDLDTRFRDLVEFFAQPDPEFSSEGELRLERQRFD